LSVEHGRAPFDAVHYVAFRQQKPGEVGAVLSCNSGNQGSLHLGALIRAEYSGRLSGRVRAAILLVNSAESTRYSAKIGATLSAAGQAPSEFSCSGSHSRSLITSESSTLGRTSSPSWRKTRSSWVAVRPFPATLARTQSAIAGPMICAILSAPAGRCETSMEHQIVRQSPSYSVGFS